MKACIQYTQPIAHSLPAYNSMLPQNCPCYLFSPQHTPSYPHRDET